MAKKEDYALIARAAICIPASAYPPKVSLHSRALSLSLSHEM